MNIFKKNQLFESFEVERRNGMKSKIEIRLGCFDCNTPFRSQDDFSVQLIKIVSELCEREKNHLVKVKFGKLNRTNRKSNILMIEGSSNSINTNSTSR